GLDGSEQSFADIGRVRPAGFTKTPLQDLVGRLKENDKWRYASFRELGDLTVEFRKKLSFPNVYDKRGLFDRRFASVGRDQQPAKGRKHCQRQIINAKVIKILERGHGRAHPRPAKTCD